MGTRKQQQILDQQITISHLQMRLALCFINSYMHLGRSADLIATYCSRRRCKFAANKDADGRLIIQDSA
jgi:hypothetical protein